MWLHRAEPEGSDEREAVALVRPHGPLKKGGGELIVRPPVYADEYATVYRLDGARKDETVGKHRPRVHRPVVVRVLDDRLLRFGEVHAHGPREGPEHPGA